MAISGVVLAFLAPAGSHPSFSLILWGKASGDKFKRRIKLGCQARSTYTTMHIPLALPQGHAVLL